MALLQDELAAMLAAPTAAQRASLAAGSVRDAYVAATGGVRGTEEAAPAPVRRQPTATPSAGGRGAEEVTCPVCFDPIEDAADKAAGMFSAAPHSSAAAEDTAVTTVSVAAAILQCPPAAAVARTKAPAAWWCKAGCGGNVHAACMRRWIGKSAQAPACPLCRAPWIPQEEGDTHAHAHTHAHNESSTAPAAAAAGLSSPGGTPFVNLRRFQPGTAGGRDLAQYSGFAQRAIERRESERRGLGQGGGTEGGRGQE